MALVDTSSRRTAILTPLVPTACQRVASGPAVLDNFDRANENPLSDGGLWSASPTGGNPLQVISSAATAVTNGVAGEMFWNPTTFGPDTSAFVTVTVLPGGANYVRLHVRVSNPASGTVRTGYMMQWSNDANGCRIFKETATSTFTQIVQSAGARYVAGDKIELRATGTTIAAYLNDVSVTSVVDATFATAGNLVLGTNTTTVRLDDFGGG